MAGPAGAIRPRGAASASLLGAAVLALTLALAGCTGLPAGIAPVEGFDASRYQGRWYEIMRLDHSFERGLSHVTADYALREDGRLDVVNRGLAQADCRWRSAEGIARFQGDPGTGSLSVTFFWPFAGGYHLFALDRQDYGWAAVAGPSRDYLWILARRPDLAPEIREQLVDLARDLDFPVQDLILVDHGPTDCPSPED